MEEEHTCLVWVDPVYAACLPVSHYLLHSPFVSGGWCCRPRRQPRPVTGRTARAKVECAPLAARCRCDTEPTACMFTRRCPMALRVPMPCLAIQLQTS